MHKLDGQVIAITGASSGIGEATARELATRGARIVIGARRTDRLERLAAELRDSGGHVCTCALDVRERASVEAFVTKAVATYGRLDAFVNNAGVMPLSAFGALRVEEWEQTLDINVRGVLYGLTANEAPRPRALRQHRLDRRAPVFCRCRCVLRVEVRSLGNFGRATPGGAGW
jgi:NADP-dependent 3-hydroxy acid dehydrogenase YdfG